MLDRRNVIAPGASTRTTAALAACQRTQSQVAPAAAGATAAPLQRSDRRLTPREERELAPYIPSFALGAYSQSALHALDFFWSPTCDSSATRFRSVLVPLIEDPFLAGRVNIGCHMMPRNDTDIRLCASMLAVRNEDFGKVAAGWMFLVTTRARGTAFPGLADLDRLMQRLSARRQPSFSEERATNTVHLAAYYGEEQLGITQTPTAFLDRHQRLDEAALNADSLRRLLA